MKPKPIKKILAQIDALREKDDYPAIVDLMCQTIESANGAKMIAALEGAEAVEEMFSGEDDAGPRVATALVKKAIELGGDEGAAILALASQAAAYSTTELFVKDPLTSKYLKKEFISGLDASLEDLRTAASSASAPFRSAAYFLFLSCRTSGEKEVELALQALPKEKNADARAAMVLVLGACGCRLKKTNSSRAQSIKAIAAEKTSGALSVACACIALLLLDQTVSPKLLKELLAALKKPIALPSTWGFRKGATTTMVATTAISMLPTKDVTPFIEALAGQGSNATEILKGIAFGENPELIGTLRTKEELNPVQIKVLSAFSKPAFEREYTLREKLGFGEAESIAAFVNEKAPWWKPISAKMADGKMRKIAPAQIWRRADMGLITVPAAVTAFTKQLKLNEIEELLFGMSEWLATSRVIPKDGGWERDAELSGALFDWMEQKDSAWPKHVNAQARRQFLRSPNMGRAILRLMKQKKLAYDPAYQKSLQYAALVALDRPWGLVELIPAIPDEARTWIASQSKGDIRTQLETLFSNSGIQK